MNGQRSKSVKKYLCLILIWGMCGLGTACGNAPWDSPNVGREPDLRYSVQFREIPDPDQALYESDIVEGHEDCRAVERERIYQGSCIYRFAAVMNDENSENFYYENVLQIFREDSWKWENIPLPQGVWEQERVIIANTLVGATEEGVFLRLTDYTGEEPQSYLGYLEGAEKKLVMKWPEGMEEALVCQDSERNIYFIDTFGGCVCAWDSGGKRQRQGSLDAHLRGGLCHPVTGDMLWYGVVDGKLLLWKDMGRPSVFDSFQEAAPYESALACGPDGTLYCADAQAIWVQENAPRQLFHFLDSGYIPQKLHSIRVEESGDILCYATLDETLCLMALHPLAEGETLEQQEIVLYGYCDTFLQQLITRFNRQNSRYHITVQDPAENPRAFMEIVAGKGPDLFFLSPLEAQEYAEKGYVREMEGTVEDPSLFLSAALENGKVNGVTYGIPCSCKLRSLVFSRKIAGDRQSWTVEEMMRTVRESGAETLYWYFSQDNACRIVLECGLYDNTNTAYIDWEKGESHLDGQPFRELLEFAKAYADRGNYDSSEIFPKLQSGEIAGIELHLWSPGQLDYADTFFSGEASYVGYPTDNGKKGVYVQADCLYVNQSTDSLEGIREFMRFMLTEESQSLCGTGGDTFIMPVRLSTVANLAEQERRRAQETESPRFHEDGYLRWQEDGLDQEQLETLEELFEQAQPYTFYAMGIEDIIYEELEPYFTDARSLEETVKILDNRVQLYLDERGTK